MTTTTSSRRILAAAAATAVLAAAPARADEPGPPVPAGVVEHTVKTFTIKANYELPRHIPRALRTEQWVTDDRMHVITRDARTGRLVGETRQTGRTLVAYNAASGRFFRSRVPARPDGSPWILAPSLAESAADQDKAIAGGAATPAGETTFLGRPALAFVSVRDGGGDPESDGTRSELIVDREEHFLLRRSTTNWFKERSREITQTEELELVERLPENAAPDAAFELLREPGRKLARVSVRRALSEASGQRRRPARSGRGA